jgi:hypothetical protein
MVATSTVSSRATRSLYRGAPAGVSAVAYAWIFEASPPRPFGACTTARPSRTVTTSVPVSRSRSCAFTLLSSRPGPAAVTRIPEACGTGRSVAAASCRSTVATRPARKEACCWRSRDGTGGRRGLPTFWKPSALAALRFSRGSPLWINLRITFYVICRPGSRKRQLGQTVTRSKTS